MRTTSDDPRSTILITGATDGIGLALARLYRAGGARLILLGRRPLSELDPALFTPGTYCKTDLSDPYCPAQVEHFLLELEIEGIDLLIHNAGTGYYGPVERQTEQSIRNVVSVNLTGTILLSHRLVAFVQPVRGKIVLIGSVVSALPCPEYAVYAATKSALEGFGRSLRTELLGTARVQVIHPGATRTGLHAKIGVGRDVVDWERFPSAEDVASKIARAIQGDRRTVVIGFGNKLAWFTGSYFRGVIDAVMRGGTR